MEPIDDRKIPRMRAADGRRLSRKDTRKLAMSERALADLERWIEDGEKPQPFDALRAGPFDSVNPR